MCYSGRCVWENSRGECKCPPDGECWDSWEDYNKRLWGDDEEDEDEETEEDCEKD